MTFDERIRFRGTFRSYQQKVLDRASEYLKDRHCHIVAAPGSGKTVLGLELICRLKAPCLILSPETTIRQQWGSRFEELFLPEGTELSDYFSFRLSAPKTFTCVTYQALYAAMNHLETDEDSGDFDLIETLRAAGIRTICLDEAHHLRNDWQKALEQFLAVFRDETCLIALTATPPYDATPNEWKRYIATCGEIDDEIFVPELVAQKTLCPHQDFILFNYPTKEENDELTAFQKKSAQALSDIRSSGILKPLAPRMDLLADQADEALFVHADEMAEVLRLFDLFHIPYGEKIRTALYADRKVPCCSLTDAENALTFLVSSDSPASEDEKKKLLNILKNHDVIEKKKVSLVMDQTVRKHLLSSAGKMTSIGRICESESAALGEKLRMVILTDYIRRESLSPSYQGVSISVAGIFRALCRKNLSAPLGAVSGSLIILPLAAARRAGELAEAIRCSIRVNPIENTGYGEFTFTGSNKNQVQVVTELLEEGCIRILIGTRSLLGEGWDSPCVNSLILASTVGSFVLSNQMRGRAIRIDPKNPDKVSNIWHLITVEPQPKVLPGAAASADGGEDSGSELPSDDFRTLSRRFDCFVGPDYKTGIIRSGIQRVSIIRPPYDRSHFQKINEEMLARSKDRQRTRKSWENCENPEARLYKEVPVPPERVQPERVQPVKISNHIIAIVLWIIEIVLIRQIYHFFVFQSTRETSVWKVLLYLAFFLAVSIGIILAMSRLSLSLSGTRTSKKCAGALLEALKERQLVSKMCLLKTDLIYSDNGNLTATLYCIDDANRREQNLFCTALQEMMSPAENPRYLMLGMQHGNPAYYRSLACPSILGTSRENAEALAARLSRVLGRTNAVYTRNEQGRAYILNTRKHSFVSRHDRLEHSMDRFGTLNRRR
ncbi:MAG: DEAD/DEAH box helicase family protein [Bilifractor sp.]|jgi:superfamily II DNA or RNA helicase